MNGKRGCRVWQRDTPVDVLLLGIRLGFVSKNNKKCFFVQTKPQKSRKMDGIPTIHFAGGVALRTASKRKKTIGQPEKRGCPIAAFMV